MALSLATDQNTREFPGRFVPQSPLRVNDALSPERGQSLFIVYEYPSRDLTRLQCDAAEQRDTAILVSSFASFRTQQSLSSLRQHDPAQEPAALFTGERAAERRGIAGASILDLLRDLASKKKATNRFEQESRWLDSNRARYQGQWIALDGDRLLASGDSARDVLQRARQVSTHPLVVKIDDETLPFAGW